LRHLSIILASFFNRGNNAVLSNLGRPPKPLIVILILLVLVCLGFFETYMYQLYAGQTKLPTYRWLHRDVLAVPAPANNDSSIVFQNSYTIWELSPRLKQMRQYYFPASAFSSNGSLMLPAPRIGWRSAQRLFDCFLFGFDLEMLEIRLYELWNVVDFFVILEAPRSQSGLPKRLYYKENRERFAPFHSKIIHVVAPVGWQSSMRKMLYDAVRDYAHPWDLVHLSDVDEIPRSDVLAYLVSVSAFLPDQMAVILQMRYSYYMYRWVKLWNHTILDSWKDDYPHPREGQVSKVFRYGMVADRNQFESLAFGHRETETTTWLVIVGAGWHCSYCVPAELIELKVSWLEAFEQVPRELARDSNYVRECMRTGTDLFKRKSEKYLLYDGDDVPQALKDFPDRYSHLLPRIIPRDGGVGFDPDPGSR
jgi:beta-1,4-mannosyl-glycoprotein beta-1,4-N-acetylglucosaminyltransferase